MFLSRVCVCVCVSSDACLCVVVFNVVQRPHSLCLLPLSAPPLRSRMLARRVSGFRCREVRCHVCPRPRPRLCPGVFTSAVEPFQQTSITVCGHKQLYHYVGTNSYICTRQTGLQLWLTIHRKETLQTLTMTKI